MDNTVSELMLIVDIISFKENIYFIIKINVTAPETK